MSNTKLSFLYDAKDVKEMNMLDKQPRFLKNRIHSRERKRLGKTPYKRMVEGFQMDNSAARGIKVIAIRAGTP